VREPLLVAFPPAPAVLFVACSLVSKIVVGISPWRRQSGWTAPFLL